MILLLCQPTPKVFSLINLFLGVWFCLRPPFALCSSSLMTDTATVEWLLFVLVHTVGFKQNPVGPLWQPPTDAFDSFLLIFLWFFSWLPQYHSTQLAKISTVKYLNLCKYVLCCGSLTVWPFFSAVYHGLTTLNKHTLSYRVCTYRGQTTQNCPALAFRGAV